MRAPTISTIFNQMKGFATKQIGFSIWQKLFHDHVIRNEREYFHVAEYIENNPRNWKNDCFFVGARIARPLFLRIARPQHEFANPVLSRNDQIVQQAICSIPRQHHKSLANMSS